MRLVAQGTRAEVPRASLHGPSPARCVGSRLVHFTVCCGGGFVALLFNFRILPASLSLLLSLVPKSFRHGFQY